MCYTLCITRCASNGMRKRPGRIKRSTPVDFETASRMFADPCLMLNEDRVLDVEQRWHAIGAVWKAVLLVVHVYREEDPHDEEEVIRIISAREADPRARRIYLEQAPY